MSTLRISALIVAMAATLAACSTPATQRAIADMSADRAKVEQAVATPVILKPRSRVGEVSGALLTVSPVAAPAAGDWLRQQTINVDFAKPTPLTAVVASLAAQGINISSSFPLETYTFAGRLTRADGETALRAIMAAVGLDYSLDDARKLVTIKTMRSETYFLNLRNRRAAFATNGAAGGGATSSTGGQSNGGMGQGMSSGGSSGASSGSGGTSGQSGNGGAQNGGSSAAQNGSGSSGALSNGQGNGVQGNGISVGDDIWSSIDAELSRRLQVMVPAPRASSVQTNMAAMPMGMPSASVMPQQAFVPQSIVPQPATAAAGAGDLFVKKTVGHYALNPETGAITVQAPSWILSDLKSYFDRVQEMYNAVITFKGRVFLVTSSNADSEGIDLTAFVDWAGKYGLILSNNALGGVTVSLPSTGESLPSVTAPNVNGPLAGLRVQGAKSALQVFNAFLSERGSVSVMQNPLVSTTSGTPGKFEHFTRDTYNTVSQTAAAGGTGSAAVGTSNTVNEYRTGVKLEVSPSLDVGTGLVRSPLSFEQIVKARDKTVQQTITVGNNALQVNTIIPVLTYQAASGEVLVRDGDLIIVGGQTETATDTNATGLPGQDGPLVGLFGSRKTGRVTSTTYFALQVEITKRN